MTKHTQITTVEPHLDWVVYKPKISGSNGEGAAL